MNRTEGGPAETGEDGPAGADEFGSRVIAQMYDLFVFPELERRGMAPDRRSLRQALVTLAPGAGVSVALNEEAQLAFQATSTRPIKAGQPVTMEDIDPATITGLRPVDVHPDAGWVALAEFPGVGVVVSFDFTRNRGRARRLLDKALAFHGQAEHALAEGKVSPALDLAFSAAELAVTALMSLLLDTPTRGRNQHGRRLAWFSQWTRLGNSPREFHQLLGRLASLRPRARYGDEDPLLPDEAAPLLAEVLTLIDHAKDRVGDPLPQLPQLNALA